MEIVKILVIEDDAYVSRTIERCLRNEQFQVSLANNGVDGFKMACEDPPDLVILDIIMHGMDGYAVCRAMRANSALHEIPILFLTAKIKPEDKLIGLRAGADDYLCKPFNLDELLLRVLAILRRTLATDRWDPDLVLQSAINKALPKRPADYSPVLEVLDSSHHSLMVGGYILDTRTFELQTPARGKVRLTPLQYDLIYHLMTHPGETFTPARLLNEIWDYPVGRGSPDLVRVHVKTLRERIEHDPQMPTFLQTVPGKGYTINFDNNNSGSD